MPNLYVTEPGALVEKEAGRIIVTKGDDVLLAVPAARLESVVIVGNAGLTTPAIAFLLDRGIGLVFLTSTGAFRGRLTGDLSKNIARRRLQYRRAGDESFCVLVARACINGKIRNCRTLCMRFDDGAPNPLLTAVIDDLHHLLARLEQAQSRDELMGVEGEAARRYFASIRLALLPPCAFLRRGRRPPPDPVNAVFSAVYTLLHESCHAALEAVGLDPYCGFLHQEHYGRSSLSLDLMEEFRPIIADSVTLTLLNKHILSIDDFVPGGEHGVYLSRTGWAHVVTQYRKRLQTAIRPPAADRAVSYQRLLEIQARRMVHVLEGEVAEYQPFLAK